MLLVVTSLGSCFSQTASENDAKRHEEMMDILYAKPKTEIKTKGMYDLSMQPYFESVKKK